MTIHLRIVATIFVCGSLAASAIFAQGYRPNLSQQSRAQYAQSQYAQPRNDQARYAAAQAQYDHPQNRPTQYDHPQNAQAQYSQAQYISNQEYVDPPAPDSNQPYAQQPSNAGAPRVARMPRYGGGYPRPIANAPQQPQKMQVSVLQQPGGSATGSSTRYSMPQIPSRSQAAAPTRQTGQPSQAVQSYQRWNGLQQEYRRATQNQRAPQQRAAQDRRRVPARMSGYQDDPFGAILEQAIQEDNPAVNRGDPFGEVQEDPAPMPVQRQDETVFDAFADPPTGIMPGVNNPNAMQDPQGVPPKLPGDIPQDPGSQQLPVPTPVPQNPQVTPEDPDDQYQPDVVRPPEDDEPARIRPNPLPRQIPAPQNMAPQNMTPRGQGLGYGQRPPIYPAPTFPNQGQYEAPPTYAAPSVQYQPGTSYPPAQQYAPPVYQPQAAPVYSPPIVGPENVVQPGVYQPVMPPIVQSESMVGMLPCDSGGCDPCRGFGQLQQCTEPLFYLSIFGGGSDPTLNAIGGTDPGQYSLEDGSLFGVALGRKQGVNLRSELEFTSRSYDGETLTLGGAATPITGPLDVYTGMLNAYWDFKGIGTRCINPYVGAGVGFGFFDAQFFDGAAPIVVDADRDSSFAYQYMVGLNYNMYQSVNLFVEYRKFMADDLSITGTPGFRGDSDRYDFESGDIVAGVRLKF